MHFWQGVSQVWASSVAQLVKKPPPMRETWLRSQGWEDPLEKGKAIHSSTLAWRIPWLHSPCGLQRAGHDWEISLSLFLQVCVLSEAHRGWTVFLGSTTLPTISTWSLDSLLHWCSLWSLGSGTVSQTSSLSYSFLLCDFEGRDFDSMQISHSSSNFLFIHWLIYIYMNLWFPVCEFLSIALSIYF